MSSTLYAPPGPVGIPGLGVLPQFRRNPAEYLVRLAHKYGDVTQFRLGTRTITFLNRPDLIEDVLVSTASNFRKSPILQRAKVLLGEGLLTAEGSFHIQQRKLMQPAFYRERLAGYAGIMAAAASETSERWNDGETIDVSQEMMRLTLRIVGLTLFGTDIESGTE